MPPLRGRVNDYANVLAPNQIQALESQLSRLEQDTGHQVAILTLPSLGGEVLEDFSIRVAEKWKIGQKGFDNGAILLIAIEDRRLRLEVGYGLEGILPDAIAKRIISNYIVPRFRARDYAGGIVAGIGAVDKVIRKEPLPASTSRQNPSGSSNLNFILMFGLTIVVLGFIAIASTANRRRSGLWGTRGRRGPMIWGGPGGWGGGGGGGFGGGGFSGGGGSFGGGGASGSC